MKYQLLFCYLFLGLMPYPLQAALVKVGPPHTCKTIHQALLMARNGDTVLVEAGLYREKNIVVSKAILLQGVGYPVLDGENKYEILSVKSNHVIVDGFKIQHCGHSDLDDLAGIKIYDAQNVTIRNNILDDTFFGIYTQFGKNCTIQNNRIKAYGVREMQIGNGIHCWKSDSMIIIGNTITGHRDGIYFEFVTHSSISQNKSTGNVRYGLHFMFSDNDVYEKNTFTNNGSGVAVMYSKGVNMFNNKFENNWGDASFGLLLKDMSNGIVKGNIFESNTIGITLEGGTNMRFEQNSFRKNGYALKVMSNCRLDTFVHNNFLGNTFDAATNGQLQENLFNNNYWDKYEGYDLNRDAVGDIPYHPVSLYSVLVERMPYAVMLMRSFTVDLLNRAEKNIPSIVPQTFVDDEPLMKRFFAND